MNEINLYSYSSFCTSFLSSFFSFFLLIEAGKQLCTFFSSFQIEYLALFLIPEGMLSLLRNKEFYFSIRETKQKLKLCFKIKIKTLVFFFCKNIFLTIEKRFSSRRNWVNSVYYTGSWTSLLFCFLFVFL